MKFETPLLRGRLIERYKRFFADITLDSGEAITAHTPNTGRTLTCKEPGSVVYVSPADNHKRKLKFTWELVQSGTSLVGVNTGRANGLAEEAIRGGLVAELQDYEHIRREVRYGENSRIDLLLEHPQKAPCYVEVKSVTLAREGVALFPDAVTARGAKHMRELAKAVHRGHRAAVLFAVQREDCEVMAPADEIDPVYGESLRAAARQGVAVLAYQAKVAPRELCLYRSIPVQL